MKNDKNQLVDWSCEHVVNWLNSNGWHSLVNVFIDYNIHHDRFLNLNMENIDELCKQMNNITRLDKQRLVFAIQKLKAKDQIQKQQVRIAIPSFNNNNRKSDSILMSSSPSPTSATSTLNNVCNNNNNNNNNNNFDISQYIPKRTSSNETNVVKMLEAFQPTLKMQHVNNTISSSSPRINATDPEILSKLFGKRLPLPKNIKEHRIQVTLDADTFIRLWIKHSSNALDIKHAVLYKLAIDAEPNYFLFYHENGIQSTIPLNDDELVYICQTSDDNRTNRVLVVPVEGYNLVRKQKPNYSRSNYSDTTYSIHYILSATTNSPLSFCLENSVSGIQLSDPDTPREELPLLTDLAPVKTLTSNDLWATMPAYGTSSATATAASATATIPPTTAYGTSPAGTSPAGTSPTTAYASPELKRSPAAPASLWHIRPSSASPSSTTNNSLWPVGEGISLYDLPTPIDTPPSPIGSIDEMFGERPSVEKLYRDIDKYLPGHDLDKEIVAPATAIPPIISKRLLGHRQSIRLVAKEAHQRWKQATNNVIMVNTLLRRKSTKMWDRPVERVKPGEESRIIATPIDTPIPTKMQWMRGNLIGRGSFGRVYHALNIATGDWLAVKQVDVAITQSDRRNQDLQAASDALYREIRLLKDLDHENIVQYIGYDSNVAEGHIYIFLEYVPGGSISSLLSQYQFFNEALTKFFTRQILNGLQYLHTRNILHRDIKAGNVLIDQNGVCKITDFGLSKNQQEGAYDPMSNNSTMRGTVFWMAPEVLTNNYSAKVDVWSLGCTVLEMITGEHPWMELTSLAALYQIGKHNAPAIPTTISNEAKDFLQLCLEIKPEDRPTASELLLHPFVQLDSTFDFKESLKLQKLKETNPTHT